LRTEQRNRALIESFVRGHGLDLDAIPSEEYQEPRRRTSQQ
jgi:hypothetical protein